MGMQYIRDYYSVPARIGGRVRFTPMKCGVRRVDGIVFR